MRPLATWPPLPINSGMNVAGSSLAQFHSWGTLLHGIVRPKQLNPENSSQTDAEDSFYGDSKFYLVKKINYTQYLLGSAELG